MAEPCLTVLLPNEISEIDLKQVGIGSIANQREKKNFWVGGQPFLWSHNSPDEEEGQLDLKGWNP